MEPLVTQNSLQDMEYTKGWLRILGELYFVRHYINLEDDSFITTENAYDVPQDVLNDACFSSARASFAMQRIHREDREEYLTKTSLSYMRSVLCNEKRSYSLEYRRCKGNGSYVWVRVTLVLVDTHADGVPFHVLYCAQYIDEEKRKQELMETSLFLMRDGYYRIGCIDLDHNSMVSISIAKDEAAEEQDFLKDYRQAVICMIDRYVAEPYQETVRQTLLPERLCTILQTETDCTSLTYLRRESDAFHWVRSELQPMHGYGVTHHKVLWYVKNISEEQDKLEQMNSQLISVNDDLNKRIEAILNGIFGGFFICYADREYHYLHVTDSVAALQGYTPQELRAVTGGSAIANVYEEDRAAAEASMWKQSQEKQTYSIKYRVRHKDGSLRWVEDSGKQVISPDGTIYFYCLLRDINTEEELRLELQRVITLQEQMLTSLPCGVLAYTLPNRQVLVANHEACHMFDHPQSEISSFGSSIENHILVEDHPRIRQVTKALQKVGDSVSYIFRLQRTSGKIRTLQCFSKLQVLQSGQEYVLSVIQDITESQRKTAALNDLTVMQEAILGGLNTGVLAYTLPERKPLLCNDVARQIFQCDKQTDPVQAMWHFLLEEVQHPKRNTIDEYAELLQEPGDTATHLYHVVRNGRTQYIQLYGKLLAMSNGNRVVVVHLIDLTSSIELRQDLENERLQYRDALTQNALYSLRVDITEGIVTTDIPTPFSENIEEELDITFPCSFESLLLQWQKIQKPHVRGFARGEVHTEFLLHAYQEGKTNVEVEYYVPQRDGYYRVSCLLSEALDTGHIQCVLVCHDITQQRKEDERKRQLLEQANQKLEQKLSIIDALSRAFFTTYSIDLQQDHLEKIYGPTNAPTPLGNTGVASAHFALYCKSYVLPAFRAVAEAFCDLTTLEARFGTKKSINAEYVVEPYGWVRATFIEQQRDKTGKLAKVLFVTQLIDEEKSKEEQAKMALEQAYENANRANTAKTDFLARMSHDIRTPMNAIMGMTALAEAHKHDVDKVEDCLQKIKVSSKHLLELINQVLDMSKIESGNMDLSEETFHIASVIDHLLTMCKPEITKHHHTLLVDLEGLEHELVIGDSQRLQQAFMNLMSNAIKYTPDGGTISLKIREKPTNRNTIGLYEFVFEDNGIGMEKDVLEHLFEPFHRGKSETVANLQGTGLGMAITKNIISMMNGDIQVESTPQQGTRFTVRIFLPLAPQQPANLPALSVLVVEENDKARKATVHLLQKLKMQCDQAKNAEEAIACCQEKQEPYFAVLLSGQQGLAAAQTMQAQLMDSTPHLLLISDDDIPSEQESKQAKLAGVLQNPLFPSRVIQLFRELLGEPKTSSAPSAVDSLKAHDFTGKRALLVEDNALNAEIALELLSMTNLTLDHVQNGLEAVQTLQTVPDGYYDLIFMDIQMPVLDGLEAAKAIRKLGRDYTDTVPILAMSANAFAEDVETSRRAGMNDHLAKPLDIPKVLDTMEIWLHQNTK